MDTSVHDLWDHALAALEKKVDAESFAAWLQPARPRSFENSRLTIDVPNASSRNWLASHYLGLITSVVEQIADRPVEIDFVVRADRKLASRRAAEADSAAGMAQAREAFLSARLNEQYTFEHFIVGESNRFAHAAARAGADPNSKVYNPLFIHGGVGLGKTHLMQAIGHEQLRCAPDKRVLYITSEQFMNAYVESVTQGTGREFRNYYRNIDLLLIDDVQFFMGKDSTQTEFFHTFNDLYDSGRKIVVTCDRPPKELENLVERLRSRFEWGLIVDIQPPDLETRMAILRAKASMLGLDLPYDVAIYIAERIRSNIRKLEGVLQLVKARGVFDGHPITRDAVSQFVSPFLVGEEPKKVSPERVARIVCEYFDVDVETIRGKSRLRKYALPRHFAMYFCRQLIKLSYPEIGQFFGNRDHTSVMHACRKIEEQVDAESNVQNLVAYLSKKIQDIDIA